MCDRRYSLLGVAAAIVLCGAAAACARPIGDFGRPQPGVLHDEVMPAVGSLRAEMAGEPVSAFNWSDEEREMHDRVWRFLVAPHANDWFMDTAVELQRTRLVAASDHKFAPSRYYRWLHQSRYTSSTTRYRTIADHARTDADSAPATFRSICKVLEIDRQRRVASAELRHLAHDEVAARRAENEMHIAWFTRALRYRYDAYNFALDNLLVETPHQEAVEADARLGALAYYVESAERGEFCIDGAVRGGAGRGQTIPSRVLMPRPGEGDYLK